MAPSKSGLAMAAASIALSWPTSVGSYPALAQSAATRTVTEALWARKSASAPESFIDRHEAV